MTRTFEDKPAVREAVPLILGAVGPSGGGKTWSALELATGIQSVSGGDIGVIDTESKRALHYADKFKFRHLPFGAPFGSLDYLAAIEHFAKKGVRQIIVDSMSHEHEGPGGHLELFESELNRIAGKDWKKRERCKFLAWDKPKSERRRLVNTILQMDVNFIFCYRAKRKIKIQKGKDPESKGWQPIGGEDLTFEMQLKFLFPPNARGVPDWNPEEAEAKEMFKIPGWADPLIPKSGQPVTRATGAALATWAAGDTKTQATPAKATTASTGAEDGPLDPVDYAACSTPEAFDALEAKRKAQWAMFGPNDKKALKAASDEAKGRLMEVAG